MLENLPPKLPKADRPFPSIQKIFARLPFLLIVLILTLPIGCAEVDDATANGETKSLLTKADGFEGFYLFSFAIFDKCGDYTLGKEMREATLAKVESCPFTPEAKEKFYKNTALNANEVLSSYIEYFKTHSELPDSQEHYCVDEKSKQARIFLQDRYDQYKAGKIKLADVLATAEPHPGNEKKSGDPVTCTDGVKFDGGL